MVLIETVGQKTKIRDAETSRPKIRESETQRNTRKRDFATHSKRLRDFEIDWDKNFRDPEFSGYHSLPLCLSRARQPLLSRERASRNQQNNAVNYNFRQASSKHLISLEPGAYLFFSKSLSKI